MDPNKALQQILNNTAAIFQNTKPQDWLENIEGRVTSKQIFDKIYNIHFRELLVAESNIEIFKGRDMKEVLSQRARMIGPGMAPVIKDVTVKDELEHWRKVKEDNQKILDNLKILEKKYL